MDSVASARNTLFETTRQDGIESHSSCCDSLLSMLLVVPFGFYFAVVVFIFVLECCQFVLVWRKVSRAGGFSAPFRDVWNHQYHGLNSNNDSHSNKVQYNDREIQQCILLENYVATNTNSLPTTCSICLGDFQEHDSVATIRNCHCCMGANLFHRQCLTQWLHERPSCPYCRVEVSPGCPAPSQSLEQSTTTLNPVSESLEMASLQVEQRFCDAFTLFGAFICTYLY